MKFSAYFKQKYLLNILFYSMAMLSKISLDSLYACPTSLNYTLQGNSYASTYSYLSIQIKRCTGSKCKSLTEINNAINGKMLNMVMVNTYFDLEDYSSPVKTYLDDRINFAVTSGYTKTTILFAQLRGSTKSDDYLRFN